MGGWGAGLLLKCHYETVRGFAHGGRSRPTFRLTEAFPFYPPWSPTKAARVRRIVGVGAGKIFFGVGVKF
jgi:hypothetical protein